MIFGMGLQIQDKFNHTNKYGELKATEGNEYPDFKFKVLEVGDVNSKVFNIEADRVEEWSSQILWNKLFYQDIRGTTENEVKDKTLHMANTKDKKQVMIYNHTEHSMTDIYDYLSGTTTKLRDKIQVHTETGLYYDTIRVLDINVKPFTEV